MADQKITELGANTSPLSTDVTVIVDDPGGTPATQKITLENLLFGLARTKVGSFTRDLSAASGDVAYTGVGFSPKAVLFIAILDGSNAVSVGIDNATLSGGMFYNVTTFGESGLKAIFLATSGGVNQNALIKTLDSDGFTLTWTKNGSPTGTASVYYLAFR